MWSLVKVWNLKFENKTTSVFNVPCYSCSLSLSDILSLKSIPSWAPVNGLWWGSVWRTVLDLMWWVFLVIYQFPPSRVRAPGTYWARHLIVGPCLVQRSLQGAFFQPSFLFLSESEISKYQRHSVGDLTKMLVLDINSMWRYFDYFTVSSQWKTFFRGALVFQPFQEVNVKSVSDSGQLSFMGFNRKWKRRETGNLLSFAQFGQDIGKVR